MRATVFWASADRMHHLSHGPVRALPLQVFPIGSKSPLFLQHVCGCSLSCPISPHGSAVSDWHDTTNLTVFFRENSHFEYLSNVVLPELAQQNLKKVELWSAGCSSGQEPYTLSIVMQEFIRENQNSINDYSILATDISSKVLDKAIDAVYPMNEIENLSYDIKKRYFLKSKNQENPTVRVKPETRQKVNFARLNFMDSSYPKTTQKNVIFCRNVLIYFDKKTQESVVRKLLEHLAPGGYLFLGHSETIFGMDLPLKTVGPTIFKKI